MADPITRDEAAQTLADIWDSRAEGLEEIDRKDRAAVALRRCADDLRRVTTAHAVEYVTHAQVKIRTGRSDSYLYRMYQQLRAEGRARKGRRGWEVAREAAAAIPLRPGHDPIEATHDLDDLAAMFLDRARRAS